MTPISASFMFAIMSNKYFKDLNSFQPVSWDHQTSPRDTPLILSGCLLYDSHWTLKRESKADAMTSPKFSYAHPINRKAIVSAV